MNTSGKTVNGNAGGTVVLSADDRAALERMAGGGENRAALRAKAVLALADGASVAEASRRILLTEKTVRAARSRFISEGAEGLRVRSGGCGRAVPAFDAAVPAALKNWRSPGRTGPLPLSRLGIETWVRNGAALGLLRPGSRLPERAWFRSHFRASAHVVQSAFDDLVSDGFVRTVPRGASFVAGKLPFAGRFLLVLEAENGICFNLEKAARAVETLRPEISWDVFWRSHARPRRDTAALARDIAAQRYCGVFMRFAHSAAPDWAPGPAQLASIPNVPIAVDKIYRGTVVSPLVRALDISKNETWDAVFASMARAGRRRVLVVDSAVDETDREPTVRAAARRHGVKIPDGGYVSIFGDFPIMARQLLNLLLRAFSPGGIDAILVRRDDHLKPLAEALRACWGGKAAARVPVVVWSAGRLLSGEGLNVEWRGCDLVATLLSFVDWCEAVRRGDPAPPEPLAIR